jgi:hypothetical protein
MDGWIGGWMGGRESWVKDCLQQSKKLVKKVVPISIFYNQIKKPETLLIIKE